jgi:hypothetical protein
MIPNNVLYAMIMAFLSMALYLQGTKWGIRGWLGKSTMAVGLGVWVYEVFTLTRGL